MRICPRCRLKYANDEPKCFVDGAMLEDAPDERVGTTIAGKYLIEEPLGEGGMAIVYRARHVLVDRPVAVKVLGPHVASQTAMKERFRREAKNAAALTHPNIIEIFDHGETEDGAPYLVMELLKGSVLADVISRGPIPAEEAAAYGLQIAEGLARAHDFDVIHRDLKPDNVFVHNQGGRTVLKLLDFGIARSLHDTRLTSVGEIFGTPQYMAPERITSIDAGESADLYALGVMLFEMVTGKLPFEGDTIPAFFIKHLTEEPPRPSTMVANLPPRLEHLILALMAKKPEERPVDAHQVIKELAAIAPHTPLPAAQAPSQSSRVAAPTLPPTTLERWARRTALFEAMIQRAFPHGGAPPDIVTMLDEIRNALRSVHEIRSNALKEQRKLDLFDHEAREARERLGHAVQSLAQDLSQAREASRAANAEVEPYLATERQARAGFEEARAKLTALGGLDAVAAPSELLGKTVRDIADAIDRWTVAFSTGDKARHWLESRASGIHDLEYQVQVLRGHLATSEAAHQERRQASEDAIVAGTRQAEAHEKALIGLATRFCEALRPVPTLADLFERLETEAAG